MFGWRLVRDTKEEPVVVTETEINESKEEKEMKKTGKSKKILGAALGAGAAIGAVAFALLRQHSCDPESEFNDAEVIGDDSDDAGEVTESDFTEE